MSVPSETLASAYARLDWALSRHDEMERTFEAFMKSSDDGTPYEIEFRRVPKPPGAYQAYFNVEREMPVEMSLLAGDLAHSTRVALDHTLARLKERFGGDAGKGSFPICKTADNWTQRIIRAGQKSPLHGLQDTPAFDLIHSQQPLHRASPEDDPLVIVNQLDNDDKHRLLNRAFVYTGAERGVDLIEVREPRLVTPLNHWLAGQPLTNGTLLASYLLRRGTKPEPLRARKSAQIGFAVGNFDNGRIGFVDMIQRVREIVDDAAHLLAEPSGS